MVADVPLVAEVPLVADVPLLAVVVAVVPDAAAVVEDDEDELPHAPTAIAAAMANGIIFFKASLRVQGPDRAASETPGAMAPRTPG